MSTTRTETAVMGRSPAPHSGPVTDVASPMKALPAATDATHRSRWWVWVIVAIVIAAFGLLVWHLVSSATSSAAVDGANRKGAHDLPVVVATARRGDLDQYLIGLGTVTPLNTAIIRSRVDGAITQIAFTEGQTVKAGDFLLQIDPRPYEAVLKQAQGQLAKDQAAKDSADWNVKQDALALKDNGISQQQMHNDTATRDQAAGAMQIDQAAIDNANLNLTFAHITAPISGRIGLRIVDIGNIVHASDSTGLAVITQEQPITVVFNLPEDDIAQIQKHTTDGHALTVDAYDRNLVEKIATGTVLAIDNQIDPTTGTVRIKAQFDNKDNELFPSQFVNARLLVNTIRDALLVPAAGIQHSPTSTFAYVVVPSPPDGSDSAPTTKPSGGSGARDAKNSGIKGIVAMREVTVGPMQAAVGSDGVDTTVVLTGLQPGDLVVTDGVDKLQDGSKVIAHMAAPPAPAGKRMKSATGPTSMEAASQPMKRSRRQK